MRPREGSARRPHRLGFAATSAAFVLVVGVIGAHGSVGGAATVVPATAMSTAGAAPAPCRPVWLFAAAGTGADVVGAVSRPLSERLGDRLRVVTAPPPSAGTSYAAAQQEAVGSLSTTVTDVATRCPDAALMLVGYSEGAHVAGDLASRIGTGQERGIPAERILAVGLFGDPARSPFTRAVPEEAGGQGVLPVRAAGFGALDPRTIEICAPGDPVCDSPAESAFPSLEQALKAPIHASYPQLPVARSLTSTQWAADSLAQVAEAVPDEPPGGEPAGGGSAGGAVPATAASAPGGAGSTRPPPTSTSLPGGGPPKDEAPAPGNVTGTEAPASSAAPAGSGGGYGTGGGGTAPATATTTTTTAPDGSRGAAAKTTSAAPATTSAVSPTTTSDGAQQTTTSGGAQQTTTTTGGSAGGSGEAGGVTDAVFALAGTTGFDLGQGGNVENGEVPVAVASPNVPGRQAVKMELPAGGTRSEVRPEDAAQDIRPGERLFFGYSAFLPQDFPTDFRGFQVIWQLHDGETNGSPPVALEVQQGRLWLANVGDLVQDLGPVSPGENVTVQMEIEFAIGGGSVSLWRDGRQVLDRFQPPKGTMVDGFDFLKTGIYRDPNGAPPLSLFLNDLKIGDSLESVSGLAGASGDP